MYSEKLIEIKYFECINLFFYWIPVLNRGYNVGMLIICSFLLLRPCHSESVTDFWGWEFHEAQL